MAKRTAPLLPSTERLLAGFGERLRAARLRRRLTAKQVAERAGMAVMTLRGLERGAPGATLGAYAAVMQTLQLEGGIGQLALEDPTGRALQDAAQPGPRRKVTRSSASAAKREKLVGGPSVPTVTAVGSDAAPTATSRSPSATKGRRKRLSESAPLSSDALARLLK